MLQMEFRTSPRVKTTRKRILYKQSAWRVHHFEIWSGELVCKAVALRVERGLLVWFGGGDEPLLSEVALGVPAPEPGGKGEGGSRTGLASTLLGAEGTAAAMARRLAAFLAKPVYVCCGSVFDRFTVPLVERGLITEIKSRPECF